jgi:hypothetical protein
MKKENNDSNVSNSVWRLTQSAAGGTLRRLIGLVLMAGLLVSVLPAQSGLPGGGGKRDLDVMQINGYIGGDPSRILAVNPNDPNYLQELVLAVTGVYNEVVASAPEVRMAGIADAIAARLPDIVSIEEGTLWRIQSPGDLIVGGNTPATNVVFDYVQILVNKLNARHVHYKVAAVSDEWDIELPMFNLQTGTIDDIRQTDREAILVRADLPPGELRVSNPQSGHFQNVIEFPTLGLAFTRGWCAVDVSIRGRDFRYICPHLEQETAPAIQVLQAQELLAGPANVKMPVMIVGDFNSDPLDRDGSGGLAYSSIVSAGFKDAWAAVHRHDFAGGLTWGHDEYLADPTVAFDRRIDLVFYKGAQFAPAEADVQDLRLHRKQPPLWASDHAAVFAGFLLSGGPSAKPGPDKNPHGH